MLVFFQHCDIIDNTTKYVLYDVCRKCGLFAAEGVTLSGVLRNEDCKLMELWRTRLKKVGAEGAKRFISLISQAKGQSY